MTLQLSHITANENHIDIRFSTIWYQEDIPQLTELLFTRLPDVNIIEKQLGADRETYRLTIENNYLVLNFDCYSQSCWLEPESESDNLMQYMSRLTS